MKTKTVIGLGLLLLLLIATGCGVGFGIHYATNKHFIDKFYPVDSFSLIQNKNTLTIHMSEKERVEEFDYELSDAWRSDHGDNNWNQEVEITTQRVYNMVDFNEISIWSDADFDANHPAGSSLNDLVRFISFSPMPYIESGYTDVYRWSSRYRNELKEIIGESVPNCGYYHPIDKLVSQLTAADMQIMRLTDNQRYNHMALLVFPTPSAAKTHTIQVKIVTSVNDTFQASHVMNW